MITSRAQIHKDNIQRDEEECNRAGGLNDRESVVGKMSGVFALGLIVSMEKCN